VFLASVSRAYSLFLFRSQNGGGVVSLLAQEIRKLLQTSLLQSLWNSILARMNTPRGFKLLNGPPCDNRRVEPNARLFFEIRKLQEIQRVAQPGVGRAR
jgi:hypothetical protein